VLELDANTRAAKDTYREPTTIAREPKTGLSAVGRQFRSVRNSTRLYPDRKPRDRTMTNSRISATARTEVNVRRNRTARPRWDAM